MSLYGNVKKVGSSTFQFDKVYPNRAEMDLKADTDGVYAGRYVLVEYGQRYRPATENDTDVIVTAEGKSVVETDGTSYNIIDGNGTIIETRNDNFAQNKKNDLTRYGAVYDSTVWQKIYTSSLSATNFQQCFLHYCW